MPRQAITSINMNVVILGRKGSGKTALFNRYVYDEFSKTSMTIGAYFGMKQPKIDDTPVYLSIWDTAGSEEYKDLISSYCRKAQIFYYVIDGSERNPEIHKDVDRLEELLLEAPEAEVHILINKSEDAAYDRAVATKREVEKLLEAKQKSISLLKGKTIEVSIVSAKSGENVEEAFHSPVRKILEGRKQAKPQAEAKQAVLRKADADLASEMLKIHDEL